MKINKILVYNFKNFKEKTIINFSDNVTFLVGPNGFGKTTIFDAIEIGLTGKLARVSSKENITPENIVYNKSFFQNDGNKPVVIKIWLEKENRENLIIVRKIEEASERRRNFAPKKSFEEFSLFKQKNIKDFGLVDDIDSMLEELTQEKINNFLGLQGNYSIENIYDLFNYIQQEETTFFLKQSEQKRSDSLAFLLKTSDIEMKARRMRKISKEIKHTLEKLKRERHDELTEKMPQEVNYQKLFPYLKSVPFDSKKPFEENNIEKLNEYKEIVKQILKFKENFSVEEYNKKLLEDRLLNNIRNNELNLGISNYILNQNENFNGEKYVVDNISLLEYISLENYINNFENINDSFEHKNYLETLLKTLSVDISRINDSHIDNINEDILPKEKRNEIKNLVNTYNSLRSNLNKTEKQLEELKGLRRSFKYKFDDLAIHKHVEDNVCPFCDSKFLTVDDLNKSYDDYSKYLTNIVSKNGQHLEAIGNKLRNNLDILRQNIESKLSTISVIDIEFKNKIVYLKEQKNILDNRSKNKAINIEGIKKFVSNYIKLPIYESLQPLNWQEYIKQMERSKNEFLNNLPMDVSVYETFRPIKSSSVNKMIDNMKENYLGFDITNIDIDISEKITLDSVEQQVIYIKKQLIQYVKSNLAVNWYMIQDTNNIFGNFFEQNTEYLKSCTKEALENKLKYLDFQASLVTNSLSTKINKLTRIKNEIDSVQVCYEDEVKRYKIDMIKKLKVPFFIYSAKILQNYQQGLGIFLTYKESSNSADERTAVKFITDPHNDHDAIHQLSTGQLAVASLAFTLSLNTMFKLSEHLNFLVIDDPIQDMDSMNVLSFIEILRHNILKEYQLILSTYSDESALFMGYKFANSPIDSNILYRSVRELQK